MVTGSAAGAYVALIVGETVTSGTASGTLIGLPMSTGAADKPIHVTAVTGVQGQERSGTAQFRILSAAGTLPTAQTLPISLAP